MYWLFWGQRGRVRSGIGLARLVLGERSGFVVLSVLGRASDRDLLDGVACVTVGLERVRGLAMVWMVRG